MKFNQKLRGLLNKRQGLSFQKICILAAKKHSFIPLPIEDGIKKTGVGGTRLIPVPNLFDLILVDTKTPAVIFTDSKSKDKAHLTPSDFFVRKLTKKSKKTSTQRQLEVMLEIESRTQHIVGFTVLLRQLGRVAFVKPSDIVATPRGQKIPMQFISNVGEPNYRFLVDENKI